VHLLGLGAGNRPVRAHLVDFRVDLQDGRLEARAESAGASQADGVTLRRPPWLKMARGLRVVTRTTNVSPLAEQLVACAKDVAGRREPKSSAQSRRAPSRANTHRRDVTEDRE
jgi:hypothetical protein